MNYFSILCVILAAALLAQWPFFRFCLKPAGGEKGGTRTGRFGFRLLGPGAFALTALTWHQHFTLGLEHSFLATVLLTLLFVKSFWLFFSYEKFRQWFQYRMAWRWFFRARDLTSIMIGLFFLYMGLTIY